MDATFGLVGDGRVPHRRRLVARGHRPVSPTGRVRGYGRPATRSNPTPRRPTATRAPHGSIRRHFEHVNYHAVTPFTRMALPVRYRRDDVADTAANGSPNTHSGTRPGRCPHVTGGSGRRSGPAARPRRQTQVSASCTDRTEGDPPPSASRTGGAADSEPIPIRRTAEIRTVSALSPCVIAFGLIAPRTTGHPGPLSTTFCALLSFAAVAWWRRASESASVKTVGGPEADSGSATTGATPARLRECCETWSFSR